MVALLEWLGAGGSQASQLAANQPVDQSANLSADQSADQSSYQSADQSADKWTSGGPGLSSAAPLPDFEKLSQHLRLSRESLQVPTPARPC